MDNRHQQEGIFDRQRRSLTVAAVLSVTLVAFEALALTTVSPLIARDLGSIRLYSWIFSAFLLAQIVGTVAAGQQADRQGPAKPFLAGLVLVGIGLATAALAPNMTALIFGRALQGLGGGALITCVYTTVNAGYPDHLRPRILAVINSAYIPAALVGPAAAGFVAETFTWRAVFFGFLPVLVVLGFLAVPAFGRLGSSRDNAEEQSSERGRLPSAILLAVGVGFMLVGLRWVAGESPSTPGLETGSFFNGLLLAGGGAFMLFPALRRLLPKGTLLAKGGLPAAIASRGLFNATFFYTEAYLVLALNELSGYDATTAGMVISAGAFSGAAGMWIQERLDRHSEGRGRRFRVLSGWVLMAIGIGTIATPVILGGGPTLTIAVAGWVTASLGMGIAHLTNASIAFAHAPIGKEGTVSSSLLLADLFGTATSIGIGGALVTLGIVLNGNLQAGLTLAFGFGLALVALCLLASRRLTDSPSRKEQEVFG